VLPQLTDCLHFNGCFEAEITLYNAMNQLIVERFPDLADFLLYSEEQFLFLAFKFCLGFIYQG